MCVSDAPQNSPRGEKRDEYSIKLATWSNKCGYSFVRFY